MATELLSIPEEHVEDVIKVIETGLSYQRGEINKVVFRNLTKWCREMTEYKQMQKGPQKWLDTDHIG